MAEQIRNILIQEQDHQIDLAMAPVKKSQTSTKARNEVRFTQASLTRR